MMKAVMCLMLGLLPSSQASEGGVAIGGRLARGEDQAQDYKKIITRRLEATGRRSKRDQKRDHDIGRSVGYIMGEIINHSSPLALKLTPILVLCTGTYWYGVGTADWEEGEEQQKKHIDLYVKIIGFAVVISASLFGNIYTFFKFEDIQLRMANAFNFFVGTLSSVYVILGIVAYMKEGASVPKDAYDWLDTKGIFVITSLSLTFMGTCLVIILFGNKK